MKDRFPYIFWFIVGLCVFGMGLTVFLIIYLPLEDAKRIADTSLIFWLSTAVAGGIGYLIGNSAKNSGKTPGEPGSTTAQIHAEITTEPVNDKPNE